MKQTVLFLTLVIVFMCVSCGPQRATKNDLRPDSTISRVDASAASKPSQEDLLAKSEHQVQQSTPEPAKSLEVTTKRFKGSTAYPFPPDQQTLAQAIGWDQDKYGPMTLTLEAVLRNDNSDLWSFYQTDPEGEGTTELERKLSRQKTTYVQVKKSISKRMSSYRAKLLSTLFYYEEETLLGEYHIAGNGYFELAIGGSSVYIRSKLVSFSSGWLFANKQEANLASESENRYTMTSDGKYHLFRDFHLKTGKNLSRVFVSEKKAATLENNGTIFLLVFKLDGRIKSLSESKETQPLGNGESIESHIVTDEKPIAILVSAMLQTLDGRTFYTF